MEISYWCLILMAWLCILNGLTQSVHTLASPQAAFLVSREVSTSMIGPLSPSTLVKANIDSITPKVVKIIKTLFMPRFVPTIMLLLQFCRRSQTVIMLSIGQIKVIIKIHFYFCLHNEDVRDSNNTRINMAAITW